MADWILVPCLVALRAEFNRIAPGRDRASDGSIGDTAHQQNVSDHNADEEGRVPVQDADKVNEVHAIDVDADLRTDDPTMEKVVQFLLARCRAGAERRLRYIIFNRRIWSASSGWVQKAYTGASPHTEHAHFSASYETSREADTSSWHLEDLMALTTEDKDWIRALFERTAQPDNGGVTSKIGRDALDQGIPNGITGEKSPAWAVLRDLGTQLVGVKALLVQHMAEMDGDVDEAALAQAIVKALPDTVAAQVADLLAARLAA